MPATMETPLDVLSRAASMVETHEAREAALKRSMDRRDSPPKELPTKFLKYRRMKERGELAGTLGFDGDHSDRCSKRCAGTQTPFVNFPQDPAAAAYAHYQKQREDHGSYGSNPDILDLDRSRHQSRSPSHSASPHHHAPPYPGNPQHDQDASNAPLNLSLSSGSHQYRQSAIASNGGQNSNNGLDSDTNEYRTCRREVTQVEVSDPVIEEHFRRSLGKNYPECLARNPQLPQTPPPPQYTQPSPPNPYGRSSPNNNNARVNPVSITGTVDDHFAKSLGSEWTKIKARQDSANSDMMGGSVDDHFAKALGDTWYKIKAEKEGSSSPTPSRQVVDPWYKVKSEKEGSSSRSHSPFTSSPASLARRGSDSGP